MAALMLHEPKCERLSSFEWQHVLQRHIRLERKTFSKNMATITCLHIYKQQELRPLGKDKAKKVLYCIMDLNINIINTMFGATTSSIVLLPNQKTN